MYKDSYEQLMHALISFIRCRKGVTAIEYAVLAVTLVAIIAAVFNPSSGPLYDAMMQAKDSIVAAISDNI